MTLVATRRYAFGASVMLGLVATVLATVLVSMLLTDPERVVMAMSEGELSAFFRLILDRFVNAARTVLSLL